jgi:streptomycin 6-kinase
VSDTLVPQAFVDHIAALAPEGGPSGAAWVKTLPALGDELGDEWDLVPDGDVRFGYTALVLPVLRRGERLALKLGWPHRDGDHEHLVLQRWSGRHAVRLLAARPSRSVLLLEWLDPARDLSDVWVEEACAVIGSVLGDLNVPALPQLRPLSDVVTTNLDRLVATPGVLPPRLVDRAVRLASELLAEPDHDATTIHTDLHYENVLARPGTSPVEWVAIDPKPLAGHPGFEVGPLLWNRVDELGTGAALRWSVRRRIEVVCDEAGIDEDRARAWTTVREAIQALWAHEAGDADRISLAVAITKALAD